MHVLNSNESLFLHVTFSMQDFRYAISLTGLLDNLLNMINGE